MRYCAGKDKDKDKDEDKEDDDDKGPNKSTTTGTLKSGGRGRCRGVRLPQVELTSHAF